MHKRVRALRTCAHAHGLMFNLRVVYYGVCAHTCTYMQDRASETKFPRVEDSNVRNILEAIFAFLKL